MERTELNKLIENCCDNIGKKWIHLMLTDKNLKQKKNRNFIRGFGTQILSIVMCYTVRKPKGTNVKKYCL